MNIALHGFEDHLRQSLPKQKADTVWQPSVIRFADDVVILHRDLEAIQQLKVTADQWLTQVGLHFKASKTCISHTLEPFQGRVGFDFLGFEVRQYPLGKHRCSRDSRGRPLGFKTLIKPSKTAQKRHLKKTAKWLLKLRGQPQDLVIRVLNPVVRGWSNYYRHVVSSEVFNLMDHRLHHQLRKWAKWRHNNKNYLWRMQRYWQQTSQGLRFGQDSFLAKHSDSKIVRHVKVQGQRSPFDGDWRYWGLRLRRYQGLSPLKQALLKHQQGRCLTCGLFFQAVDIIERHHLDSNTNNNAFKNLQLLHRHCHHQLHRAHNQGLFV